MAMRQQTLTEMDAETAALRETARRYQVLVEEKELLHKAINKLEPQIAAATGHDDTLRQIAALASQVPVGLLTRGSLFIHGGHIVREVLVSSAANALTDLEVRRADLESTLQKVKARQVVNAERLKEFE